MSKELKIKLKEDILFKVDEICSQFYEETSEKLTFEDFLELSIETLAEEVDNFGTGRMFIRKQLWKKNTVYLSGRSRIIGSQ